MFTPIHWSFWRGLSNTRAACAANPHPPTPIRARKGKEAQPSLARHERTGAGLHGAQAGVVGRYRPGFATMILAFLVRQKRVPILAASNKVQSFHQNRT